MNKIDVFINDWQQKFVSQTKLSVKSKKKKYSLIDAIDDSHGNQTALDEVMIRFLKFIDSEPLKQNDYFKYVDSYKKGKKLNDKYFRHDKTILNKYYSKIDNDPAGYNPFTKHQYKKYVLFMMLKFSQAYDITFNELFDVKTNENREYNPLTSIPSVLRQMLPFKIKEFDISQAYPSFIFMELDIEPFEVYEVLGKKAFNTLLNVHSGVKDATIQSVRERLSVVYHDRVDEVVTDERFHNKGKLFSDLSKYESEYIQMFVEENELTNYVRLHDGVVTLDTENCDKLEFGKVKFKVKDFKKPENENAIINFYDDELSTSPVSYANYLKQEGFIRITQEGSDQLMIVKNDNRIVSPINHKTDIVPFLKNSINEFDTASLENRIARESSNVILQSLQLIEPIELNYHKDTSTFCDIPFKNGFVRVSKDEKKVIPYEEIETFFAKHETQKHELNLIDDKLQKYNCDFASFLIMAITNKDYRGIEHYEPDDLQKITAIFSMFGYLITNYKESGNSPAIILSDENANDSTRNGGRGKSLVLEALKCFRKAIVKGGNAYDPNYTHVHADLTKDFDLYLIDDVPSGFDYNALYTNITGDIDAQRKGKQAESIPFKDAPKFVITTNWAVRHDEKATSTNRRFIEYQFSDFWIKNKSPIEFFEKRFFDEWDENEWNKFYNFGFYCVQCFYNFGLQKIKYDKRNDNFNANFSDDLKLEEMERILKVLAGVETLSVSMIIEEHTRKSMYTYKPLFTSRNTKKHLNAYIEYHELPYQFSSSQRKWTLIR